MKTVAMLLVLALSGSVFGETDREKLVRLEKEVADLKVKIAAEEAAKAPAATTVEAILAKLPADLDWKKEDPNGVRLELRSKWIQENVVGAVVEYPVAIGKLSLEFNGNGGSSAEVLTKSATIFGVARPINISLAIPDDDVKNHADTKTGDAFVVRGKVKSFTAAKADENTTSGDPAPHTLTLEPATLQRAK